MDWEKEGSQSILSNMHFLNTFNFTYESSVLTFAVVINRLKITQ